jgi:hypothetical protein
LIEHFDGHAWRVVQDQAGATGFGVGGSRAELWVVGSGTPSVGAIERACFR